MRRCMFRFHTNVVVPEKVLQVIISNAASLVVVTICSHGWWKEERMSWRYSSTVLFSRLTALE